MNSYKEKYEKRKVAVLKLLNTTKEFCDKYEKPRESEVFSSLIKELEGEEFSIVLVGEFSAGKSTFLNALMGEKILPSFTDETTATLNFLRHKEKAKADEQGRVYFNDGKEEILENVDFDTINKYVCTKSDIGVANSVEHLDLYLDSKFLEGNVTLVDSPGLNGIADGHREITQAQIEKSSASIFMFKADQPGSKTDFEFLKELKSKVKTIIFVLNKIDDIKESEGETPESVIETLRKNYKNQFPNETNMPEIWGVSAYQALVARSKQSLDYHDRTNYTVEEKAELEEKSRMSKFENRLWKFLTEGEKAKTMLTSPLEKVMSLSVNLKNTFKDELEILQDKNDANEIQEKMLEVDNQINGIKNTIKGIGTKVSGKLSLLVDEIGELAEVKTEKLKEDQVSKLDNWNDIEELNDFENNVTKKSNDEYNKIANKCEKKFVKGLKEIIGKNYEEVAEEINENLRQADFNICISAKFEPTKNEMKLGIEKYENEIKELQDGLNEKQHEIDGADLNLIDAKLFEKQKEEMKQDINNLKSQKTSYETIYSGPTAEYENVEKKEEYWNKSLLGIPINILFGRKTISKFDRQLVNEDEIKEFKEEKKNKQKKYDDEIKENENKLYKMKNNGESIDKIQLIRKKIITKQKEFELKIVEKQKKFKEEYIKQNKTALRNKKRELEDYFDEISEEYSEKLTEELNNKKKIFLEMIKNSIANNLSVQLQSKNTEYQSLENKLKSSKEDREEYINILKDMSEEIDVTISNAVKLQSDIESEEVDEIKQQDI